MRVLVALVTVALVGLAFGAQTALAGSKKPGVSISVDLGPASVKVDGSGGDAGVSVSTPAATVDATVDSSAQTPVAAAADASTPVASTAVDVGDSVGATVSTPVASSAVRADPKQGVKASVHVESPVAKGDVAVSAKPKPAHTGVSTKVSTPAAPTGTTFHTASAAGTGNEQRAVVAPRARAGAAPAPRPVKPTARRAVKKHAAAPPAAHRPPVASVRRIPRPAAQTGSTQSPRITGVVAGASRPAAGHAPAAPGAAAPTWHRAGSAPGSAGAGGASSSGLSTAGFFAILTAFLMLAAPIVGRWLRPSIGLALQPAFASLPERPG